MINLKKYEIWFVTGSQHLYGQETLKKVNEHSSIIAQGLDNNSEIPCKVVFKPVLTTPDEIYSLCQQANTDEKCVGIITWMHTFSPSKMWISGLSILKKPLLHFHTQFNRDIPWESIDMDFMNLNQSAHGDREHGFIGARMRLARKVVAGYWEDLNVCQRIGAWMRATVGYSECKMLKVARFGDNMREVAVTEGDKVEAQIKFGWSVNGYGVGDLVKVINYTSETEIDNMMNEYNAKYDIKTENIEAVRVQAKIEVGMEKFLKNGNFGAFTTTFEDLYGIDQLPGLAVQSLMEKGYGFGGEGDWKTSALVRIMKFMAGGTGTSFMEDYTYHLEQGNELVLGAHMLEVCPSIASNRPMIEVHPLGIGGKNDPARLIFDGTKGSAICASLIDMGDRFRLIVNEVEAVTAPNAMPNLPVARVMWKPQPSLATSAEAWILAGGAHHTCLSFNVTTEQLIDFAEMAGIECVIIDKDTKIRDFTKELRWNDIVWALKGIK